MQPEIPTTEPPQAVKEQATVFWVADAVLEVENAGHEKTPTVGAAVKTMIGAIVGTTVGETVGTQLGAVVGTIVGKTLGTTLGAGDGTIVGKTLGTKLGAVVGTIVGKTLGVMLGAVVDGASVAAIINGISEGETVGFETKPF